MAVSWDDVPVIEEHRRFLEDQALTPGIVHAHGVRSVTEADDLPSEFSHHGSLVLPALVFPWTQPDETVVNQLRPAPGSLTDSQNGRPKKYIFPTGQSAELGVIRTNPLATSALIVEGTKQALVAGAYAPDTYEVYGIAGCRSWSSDGVPSPHLAVFSGKDVIVVLDSDQTTNRDVYDAAIRLKEALEFEDASSVKFARIPGGKKAGLDDVLSKRPEDKRGQYLARILESAKTKPADKAPKEKTQAEKRQEKAATVTGPFVMEDGRYQVDVGQENIKVLRDLTHAIVQKNDGETIFCYGDVLSRRTEDEGMKPVSKDYFPWIIAESARTVRLSREGDFVDSDPDATARNAVLANTEAFSKLDRLAKAPFLRADGTVCQVPGYDKEARTYLALTEAMEGMHIPSDPTETEVRDAVSLLTDDLLQGFPFASESDRANALALMLTPFIRGMVPLVPLAVVDGREAGVGKNLLAEMLAIIATGKDLSPLPYSKDDDEQRKVITSTFRSGGEIFCFDEAHDLEGVSLTKALTTSTWEDRVLGASTMAQFPNNVTWVSLGNQVHVHRDMGRRVYRIHLAFDGEHPENRDSSYYKHPDLKDWAYENRNRLIQACLTICRNWFAKGSPAAHVPFNMGSFEKWQRTMAGILESAGVEGFLDNVKEWRSESDFERAGWVSHLIWLHDTFGDDTFTCRNVRERLMEDPQDAQAPPGLEDPTPKSFSKNLGHLYFKNQDRILDGYRLQKAGLGHRKTNLYRVVELDSGQGPGPDNGPGTDPGSGPDDRPDPDPVLPGQMSIFDIEPGELVFDIETCDADEIWSRDEGFVRLSGYETGGEQVTTTDHSELVSAIEKAEVNIGHNILNFDLPALARHHGLDYEAAAAKSVDTLITARQVDPPPAKGAPNGYYSLDSVAERLGVARKTDDIKKLKRKYGGYDRIPIDVLDPYLHGDLSSSRGVYTELKDAYNSDPYIRREHRVTARLARASLEGFRVDEELLNHRLEEQRQRKESNLRRLNEDYGIPLLSEKGTRYKSPLATTAGKEALTEAFHRAGALIMRTTEKTGALSTSKDDMAAAVRFYSDPDRLKAKGIDPESVDVDTIKDLCELVADVTSERTVYGTIRDHNVNGRVHPKISPEQASGRWSVTRPGLTVLGKRGGKWREREVLTADDNCVLVAVDLDQVDARAVAGHCQDPAFMALFGPGLDFHSEVAMRVFGRADGEFRERAKVGSHGYSYGLGAPGLAKQMGVEETKAREFISQMQEQFPIHAQWQAKVRAQAEDGQLLDNGFGRKMRPDPKRAYTQGPGLIGQGATRDIIAEGILNLPEEIVPMLRVVIHDELVFCLPEDRAEELSEQILDAMQMDFFGVPITAGCSRFGKSWGELYDKG